MPSIGKIFVDTIKDEFNMRAVWRPGRAIDLGDYGTLDRPWYFSRMGNITEDFGIDFNDRKDESPSDIVKFMSEGGFEIAAIAKGEVSAGGYKFGKAGASISFTSGKAVFIDAYGCYFDQITNIPALRRNIIKEYNDGKGRWKEEFLVVTKIERARGATVIITRRKNASIDLEANVGGPTKDITNPDLGLKMRKMNHIGYEIVAKEGLNLMMETMILDPRRRRIYFRIKND